MTSETLLIQQASGSHAYLLNLTVVEHAQYCLQWGIDYQPVFGSALTAADGKRHAFWDKLKLILRGVEAGYEQVIWLDSDCYIADPDRDLREACPTDGIGATWHDNANWGDERLYDHYNAGALYLGVGPQVRRFLKLWWRADDEGHPWHDQHALNKTAAESYRALWRSEPPLVKLGHEWNATPFYPVEYPAVAAWHGCWTDIGERLDAMQTYIKGSTGRRMIARCSVEEACQKAEFCASLGNTDGALQFYARAKELGAMGADFCREYANVYMLAKRWAEAVPLLTEGLEQEPQNGVLWRALSGCYDFLGEQVLAGQALAWAKLYSPLSPPVMVNEALWLLRHGEWERGFEQLRYDFLRGGRTLRAVTPEWTKPTSIPAGWTRPLKVFVWAEQGIGDTLMLSRYIPNLCCGDTVVWEVQSPLVPLLAAQCWPGVEVVAQTQDKSIPWDFDAHIGMFSLPPLFGATPKNTSGKPYLVAPYEKIVEWNVRMQHTDGEFDKRIGFSWAGSQAHGNNTNRNCEAGLFDAIVQTPGTSWFSLQKGIEISDEVKEGNPEVDFIGDEASDMADVAGMLANLDLVITIDSAIAHLAGAMGVPCWILLSKSSDWRWLLERTDSPWYDSVRLFRQSELGAWEEVMQRVEHALKELLNHA